MVRHAILTSLLILSLSPSFAQDARMFGMAECGTGTTTDAFGIYWNPAALALGEGSTGRIGTSTGFSAWDTSNLDAPILDFSHEKAVQAGTDPVLRAYRYEGLLAFQYRNLGFGVLYEDRGDLKINQGALLFQNARSAGLAPGAAYALDSRETRRRMQHLMFSGGKRVSSGTAQMLAVGGTVKYTMGGLYDETSSIGTFTQGTGGLPDALHTHADKSRGLSYDVGILTYLTAGFHIGFMMENMKSSITWEGDQEYLAYDKDSGQESVATSSAAEWKTALPRVFRIGMVMIPEGKDIQMTVESRHLDRKTWWRFGLERAYPARKLSMTFGLFTDPTSDRTLFTVGGGYHPKSWDVNLALLTRKFPAIQDSQSLGGALSISHLW